MKVCHVITRMIVGGAQENTLFSVLGLDELPGYDVTLLTGPETGAEGNLLDVVTPKPRVVPIPHMVRSIRPVADARAFRELQRALRQQQPDVVHTHSSKGGVLGRAAARAVRAPVVVHTLHSLVFHDYQPWIVNRSYRTIKRTMVPLTDHYVSVSDNIRERAIAAGIGDPERHSTIRSGFDTDAFAAAVLPVDDARDKLGIPTDRLVIGVVGRLFPLKGHEDILRAAPRVVARHPDVLFVFVGSGPLQAQLQSDVRGLGLERNVQFLGRVDPHLVPVAFSAFDVFAHASLREGLARVIPQAVIAGVPVVAYDLDGSSEVVRHGVNGFLVAPRRTEDLAARLEEL
ncbi:MAG: glycosyltransferase, partial [Acidimicrobiia bacterium]|nr:glycosyltransferase [Acidimicrobiia bacterium]